MENKLGRKNMLEWSEAVQKVTGEMYKQAFYAGYDVAKDETPDVEDMAKLLADRYTDEELSEMLLILDSVLAPSRVKSANQQRAELVQRAREFVERKTESLKDSPEIDGGWDFKERENPRYCDLITKVEFLINDKKRTVVALLRMVNGKEIENKGIAKCMPDEVFNADIGKAIALARVLEIDVPKEFMQAVQPDEKVIGMEVYVENSLCGRYTLLGIDDFAERGFTTLYSDYGLKGTIIDDTNAQY